ncbi:MAG: CsbD family protein [Pseudomonadota bacterium]|nr:CsbD family protein [Pseudomonadota bacterium]
MDKNREEGAKRQVSGSAKEAVGKITGDRSKELKGKLEKNVGKAQREVGKATDESRTRH